MEDGDSSVSIRRRSGKKHTIGSKQYVSLAVMYWCGPSTYDSIALYARIPEPGSAFKTICLTETLSLPWSFMMAFTFYHHIEYKVTLEMENVVGRVCSATASAGPYYVRRFERRVRRRFICRRGNSVTTPHCSSCNDDRGTAMLLFLGRDSESYVFLCRRLIQGLQASHIAI
jgi:hypothetical protein